MKRRIESKLEWDFCNSGSKPGLRTTLTASKGDPERGPLLVKSVSVESNSNKFWISGHLRVDLDRRCDWSESQGGVYNDAYIAIIQLNNKLYDDKIMGGQLGCDGSSFTMDFKLEASHIGFCEEAIKRALIVLEGIGANKTEITTPSITQRTLVWVPEAHPLRKNHHHNFGWVEYGTFLGDLHGLSSKT